VFMPRPPSHTMVAMSEFRLRIAVLIHRLGHILGRASEPFEHLSLE